MRGGQKPFAYNSEDMSYGMVFLKDDKLYMGMFGDLERYDSFEQPEDDAMGLPEKYKPSIKRASIWISGWKYIPFIGLRV